MDAKSSEARLTDLIDAAASFAPPRAGGLSGALRRVVGARAARARLQRDVDLALVQMLTAGERHLEQTDARLDETSATLREIATRLDEMAARVDAAAAELRQVRAWLQQTSDRGDAIAGRLEALSATYVEDQQQTGSRFADLTRLVPSDVPLYGEAGAPLEEFNAGTAGQVVGVRGSTGAAGDHVYRGLQDFFRGSEAEIMERQRTYVPLLEARAPVLDVGCGRGELLELLRETGVQACGIDVDAAMVERCEEKGLAVQRADAVDYLRSLPDHSLGAIVATQVIEHLPVAELLVFLQQAVTKLTEGGRLIIETVNPHSPQALKHFWIDPTHEHPLFPEVVVALCALTGFRCAYIWYPRGTGDPERDRAEQLDYAVIAEILPT